MGLTAEQLQHGLDSVAKIEPRFAVVLVGSSGEGGAKLHRRNFGEAVENLTGSEFADTLAGEIRDRVFADTGRLPAETALAELNRDLRDKMVPVLAQVVAALKDAERTMAEARSRDRDERSRDRDERERVRDRG